MKKQIAERVGTTCKGFEARLRSVLRFNIVLINTLGLINVDILIMLFSRALAAFYRTLSLRMSACLSAYVGFRVAGKIGMSAGALPD